MRELGRGPSHGGGAFRGLIGKRVAAGTGFLFTNTGLESRTFAFNEAAAGAAGFVETQTRGFERVGSGPLPPWGPAQSGLQHRFPTRSLDLSMWTLSGDSVYCDPPPLEPSAPFSPFVLTVIQSVSADQQDRRRPVARCFQDVRCLTSRPPAAT